MRVEDGEGAAGETSDQELAGSLAQRAGSMLCQLRDLRAHLAGAALGKVGDLASHLLLTAALEAARPDDAVLSEESVDDPSRLGADRVWIIDPLDGTREYGLEGRPDWAVHVALWERAGGAPSGLSAAAVALPAEGALFQAGQAVQRPDKAAPGPLRVLVSDSRPPAWLGELAARLELDPRPMGSAGAKAMAVLRGQADAYLHDGGQYEWDSAAPVGVARAAGLHASRLDGSPLRYNQSSPYVPDLLICRPELADLLLEALATIGAGTG